MVSLTRDHSHEELKNFAFDARVFLHLFTTVLIVEEAFELEIERSWIIAFVSKCMLDINWVLPRVNSYLSKVHKSLCKDRRIIQHFIYIESDLLVVYFTVFVEKVLIHT